LIHGQSIGSKLNTSSYKYFADFNCKNFEFHKNKFDSLAVMVKEFEINSSNKSVDTINFHISKRSIARNNFNLRERVIGKYVSYDMVIIFYIVQKKTLG
jgi:hypothetical protein